jgi:membrane-bound lytic murein transglycosylase D
MPGPRQPIAFLSTCVLALGCAHGPGLFGSAEPAPPAPPAAIEPFFEADLVPEALVPEPPPEPSPEDFLDLLDRMRAGFSLPVVEDLRVQREIDRYVANAAFLDRTFDRGRRYLHHIVLELESRDMPRELALLPVVESAFDPFARSPRHASGLWQFIPSTGRHYGLDQDWWFDGRRDVTAATSAALDYLEELHDEFDDWFLALAAYNTGAGNVRRAIARNERKGLPTDFFSLDLHRETRAYVPKLLAIAQVAAEPERFGVVMPVIPNAPYFTRVDAGGQVDLGRVANLAGIELDELRALNPQYNRWVTAPDGPYDLLVPADTEERIQQALATLPPSERVRFERHRVRRGDTLYEIAARYRVPVAVLRTLNRVRGNLIHPGQELLVPIPTGERAAEQPTRARRPGLES